MLFKFVILIHYIFEKMFILFILKLLMDTIHNFVFIYVKQIL